MTTSKRQRGRPSGPSGTVAAIRAAGTQLLFRQGYEGMSLRDLAAEVGIQPGSLYNHFRGKQAFLSLLLSSYTDEMLTGVALALDGIKDPRDCLRAFIRYHIRFHTLRLPEASICLSELRHLKDDQRAQVQELRDRYENRLRDILDAGVSAGVFHVSDAKLATFAVLGMITSVIGWYSPDGPLSAEEISDQYSKLALAALGATS